MKKCSFLIAIALMASHLVATSQGQWINADYLNAQMKLRDAHGSKLSIRSIEIVPTTSVVYNLNVKDWHTYHAGSSEIVVHNQYEGNVPYNIPSALELQQQGTSVRPDDFADMYNGSHGVKPFHEKIDIPCPSCHGNTIYDKLELYGPHPSYVPPRISVKLNPSQYKDWGITITGPVFNLIHLQPSGRLDTGTEVNIGILNGGSLSIGKKFKYSAPGVSPANVIVPLNNQRNNRLIIDKKGATYESIPNIDAPNGSQ